MCTHKKKYIWDKITLASSLHEPNIQFYISNINADACIEYVRTSYAYT